MYLLAVGAISNVSYSGDIICAGTESDPCYAYINFTAEEDIFIYPTGYDPWGRNTLFDFDPNVKSWKLQRSWGNGWRNIPLDKTCTGTWCGAKDSSGDCKYSIAFREDRDYRIRIVALKHSPYDTIKWGAFSGVDEIDPTWLGVSESEGISQYKKVYNGNYTVIKQTGNESLYDVKFEKIKIEIINQSNRTDTIICMEANFDEKEVITYKVDEKIENKKIEELTVDKIYTYLVPEKISFYKNTSLSKQPDIEKNLIKANELSLTPNEFEEGDINKFCYQANPDEDFYLKFGDNSVIVIQDSDWATTSLLKNITNEPTFTHLTLTNDARFYFPFDVNDTGGTPFAVYDWIGNNNIQGFLATWNNNGKYGGAYDFDGTGAFEVSPSSAINYSYEGAVSMWVKQTGTWYNSLNYFLDANTDSDKKISIYSVVSSGVLGFKLGNTTVATTMTFTSDNWEHITLTWNNGYWNASLDNTFENGTYTGTVGGGETYFNLGDDTSDTYQLNGSMDEVMFFNKSLTRTEITAIYNNQSERFFSEGTQRVRAQLITNTSTWENGGFNQTNLLTDFENNLDTNISARIGQMNLSVDPLGLVLYMPFEWGSAVDISGEGNDGTMVGDAVVNSSGGKYGDGLVLDGVGDKISVTSTSSLNIQQSITVSAWAKYPSLKESNILEKGGNGGYFLWVSPSTSFRISFGHQGSGGIVTLTGWPESDKWFHIVGMQNSTGIHIFLNGVLNKTRTQNYNFTNSGDLQIGNGVDGYFNGSIDNVMVFNRSLSETEILNLYNNQSLKHDVPYYTDYQNLTANVNSTFTISKEADFIFPDYLFYSNSYNFYSPILLGDTTLYTFDGGAEGDTCTYTSGNWDVDCSDECSVDSAIDLLNNNLTLTGTGNFNVNAIISNFSRIIKYNSCQINIFSGGGFN